MGSIDRRWPDCLIQIKSTPPTGVSEGQFNMTSKKPTADRPVNVAATVDDLRRILGDLDDHKISEILALNPDIADLEEVAMCLAGDADLVTRAGHRLSAAAARIADLLPPEEEEDEPRSREST